MYDCNYVIDTPGTFHGLISASHHFQDRWSRQVPDTCAQKLTLSCVCSRFYLGQSGLTWFICF
jgi:hypothetical protein